MRLRMTDETRLHRGLRAREILDNEEFAAAFDAIEQDLTESWKNTPSTNGAAEGRERIHLALTMLHKVRASITQTMETGKLAAENLKHQKTMAQRAKEWLSPN